MSKRSLGATCVIAAGLVTAWAAPAKADSVSVDFSASFTPGDDVHNTTFLYDSNSSAASGVQVKSGFAAIPLGDISAGNSVNFTFSGTDTGNRPFFPAFDFFGDGVEGFVVGITDDGGLYVAGGSSNVSNSQIAEYYATVDPDFGATETNNRLATLIAAIENPGDSTSPAVLQQFLAGTEHNSDDVYAGFTNSPSTTNLTFTTAEITGYSVTPPDLTPLHTGTLVVNQLTPGVQPAGVPLPSSAALGGVLMSGLGAWTWRRRRRSAAIG